LAAALAAYSSFLFYYAASNGFIFFSAGAGFNAALAASSSFFFNYAASKGLAFFSATAGLDAALAASSSFLFYYCASNGLTFFSVLFLRNGFAILSFSSLALVDTNLDLS